MSDSCVVFADASTVPDRIAQHITPQNRLVGKGVFASLAALEQVLEAEQVDWVLIDPATTAQHLPDLIARYGDTHRLVLVDENGLFALHAIDRLSHEPASAGAKGRSKSATAEAGTVRIEFQGQVLQSLWQQLESGQPSIAVSLGNAASASKISAPAEAIYVRSDSRISRIALSDLVYVEAQKDYVVLRSQASEFRILGSMKRIVQALGEHDFFRVHRSFIIRLDKIERIEGEDLYLTGFDKPIPVGPSYRSALIKTLRLL